LKEILNVRNAIYSIVMLALIAALACGAPTEEESTDTTTAGDSQASQSQDQPAQPDQPTIQPTLAQPSGMSGTSSGGAVPTAPAQPTEAPPETAGVPVQADLRVAITPPYAENLLGWRVGGTNQGILQPMQENLIQRDYQTWAPLPMLAAEWSVAPNGQDWSFKLREGVPFHKGDDTFGVSDFIFSMQLWTHPESLGGYSDFWHTLLGPPGEERSFFAEEFGTAGAVEVVSDSEMIMHLGRPELDLLAYASDAFTDPLIYSLAWWEQVGEQGYGEDPVGTGPWKFINYDQGSKLEYERVPYDHWRVTPDFETLTYFFAGEDLTRVAMLRTNEADIAEIPRELQESVVDEGYAIARSTLPAYMVWIAIGGQYLDDVRDPNDPNTNVLVRRAMNHAIDRDAINKAYFDNKMELMANTGWHPTDITYDASWEVPTYDPALAVQLLAEAGYAEGDGPKVEFMAGKLVGVPELTEIAVPIISWMEEVGFQVDAQIGEFQPIRTRYKAREMNGVLWTHRTGFWPAGRNMRAYFVSPALDGGVFMLEDPHTEDLFDRWQNSVDEEERLNLMKAAGQYMYEQSATMPLGFLFAEFGINPNVIAEYSVNNSYFGGMKGHEYTKVVRN
jgi:peptide/nickel transport system substrate-binding protein